MAIDRTQPIPLGEITCIATWKELSGRYVSSTALFIGLVKIADYYFNGARPKGDPLVYSVKSHVNSINLTKTNYATTDECEVVCVQIAKKFCEQLNTK